MKVLWVGRDVEGEEVNVEDDEDEGDAERHTASTDLSGHTDACASSSSLRAYSSFPMNSIADFDFDGSCHFSTLWLTYSRDGNQVLEICELASDQPTIYERHMQPIALDYPRNIDSGVHDIICSRLTTICIYLWQMHSTYKDAKKDRSNKKGTSQIGW